MVRSLDHAAVQAFVAELIARPPRDMRGALTDWALRSGVDLA